MSNEIKYLKESLDKLMVHIPGSTQEVRDFVDPVKWISENYQMSMPGKTKGLVEVIKTIEVKPFYMSKYAVSEAIYKAVMGDVRTSSERYVLFEHDNLPVVNISWIDAITFCNALSVLFNLTPCYTLNSDSLLTDCDFSASGFRLPTIAEWQSACRGGQKGYLYDNIDEIAWYSQNSEGQRHENGLKKPNNYGLFDMIGNVWEWCWDLYDRDRYDNYRLFCGGSFAEEKRGCGATSKRRSQPDFKIDDLGFRLCRTINEPIK